MNIDDYMQDVQRRLAAVGQRRDEIKSATLGPLTTRRQELEAALRTCREQLRLDRDAALKAQAEQAKKRRQEASQEAARICEEADRQAKELRSTAKKENEEHRATILAEYTRRLNNETQPLQEMLLDLTGQESASVTAAGRELAEAEDEYRSEYEKVVADRIITRKALTSMGFAPPSAKKRGDDKQKVDRQ